MLIFGKNAQKELFNGKKLPEKMHLKKCAKIQTKVLDRRGSIWKCIHIFWTNKNPSDKSTLNLQPDAQTI